MIRKYDGKHGVRWHVLVYDGPGRKRMRGTFATQKEARKAEAVLRVSGRPPDAKAPFDLSLNTHILGLEKTVGRRTLAGYRSIEKNHLVPYFGETRVGDITTLNIEDYYSELRAKGLTATSIYQHHAILRKFFRSLKRQGAVEVDPTEGAVWGRKELYLPKVLSMDELKVLFADFEGHWLHLPIILAATAGLRRGEVCGLKWEDYRDGVLIVRRSLGESKGLFEKSTKNERVRAIPLVALAREVIEERKAQLELYEETTGVHSDYVVCRKDGQPRRPSTLSDSFRGNRFGIRFHDLRHSHATIMALSGESPEAVRQRLGHSSVQVTLDLYTHLAGAQWDTVNRWDEQWCRERDSNPHGVSPGGV